MSFKDAFFKQILSTHLIIGKHPSDNILCLRGKCTVLEINEREWFEDYLDRRRAGDVFLEYLNTIPQDEEVFEEIINKIIKNNSSDYMEYNIIRTEADLDLAYSYAKSETTPNPDEKTRLFIFQHSSTYASFEKAHKKIKKIVRTAQTETSKRMMIIFFNNMEATSYKYKIKDSVRLYYKKSNEQLEFTIFPNTDYDLDDKEGNFTSLLIKQTLESKVIIGKDKESGNLVFMEQSRPYCNFIKYRTFNMNEREIDRPEITPSDREMIIKQIINNNSFNDMLDFIEINNMQELEQALEDASSNREPKDNDPTKVYFICFHPDRDHYKMVEMYKRAYDKKYKRIMIIRLDTTIPQIKVSGQRVEPKLVTFVENNGLVFRNGFAGELELSPDD